MAFPRKLKKLNLFNEGMSYLGETASVTLPKLGINTEEWKGGGMLAPVKIAQGLQALEMEFALGGPDLTILRQFGAFDLAGVFLRFSGGYEDDSTGESTAIDVTVRGRHEEIDMGEAKPGEGGEFKVKSALVYYRLDWNGATEIEIDVLNGVFMTGGVDRYAELMAIVS